MTKRMLCAAAVAVCSQCVHAGELYSAVQDPAASGSVLVTINPDTGELNEQSQGLGVSIQAMAYIPGQDRLIASAITPGTPDWAIYDVDRHAGAVTKLFDIGFNGPAGLAYDTSTNTLFAGSSSGLSIVDLDAGQLTSVGSTFTFVSGMTYIPGTDQLLYVDAVGGSFGEIDRTTGLFTQQGELGVTSMFGTTFDQQTQTLYGVRSAGNQNALYTITPTTGDATLATPVDSVSQFGLGALVSIPTPPTAAAWLLPLAVGGRRTRPNG